MTARRRLATLLIVIATLTGIATSLTLWAGVQVFDTDEWTETSERILDSEEVRTALADYLVDELEREGALDAAGLSDADEREARRRVTELLGTDQAIAVWAAANRAAHSTLLALVDERRATGSVGDGGIRLDLTALEGQVSAALGLPDLGGLGSGEVSFQVIPTDRVDEIQTAVDTARVLPAVLLAVTLGLYLVALLLAGGSRRRIGFRIGISLLLIGVAGLLVRLAGPLVIDATISPPAEADEALDAVWAAASSLLVWLSGLAALLGAFLAVSTSAWGRFGGLAGIRGSFSSPPQGRD